MDFSQIIVVTLGALGATIFAQRKGFQAPLIIVAIGLAVSLLPGLERPTLAPEVILTVVLPPLLYSATVDFSFQSFIKRFVSIANLGVILVLVTTVVVAAVAVQVVPGLALPSALVLGAVVSPPDAVTAVAIGRSVGLPKRVMSILKGESLINDAAALTLISVTVSAVAGTGRIIDSPQLYFLYAAGVGVAIGVVLGGVVGWIRQRVADPTIATAISVLTPFAAYLLAEEVSAAGVLAVVAAGFSVGHSTSRVSYECRIQERSVWKVMDSLLEGFTFAYIGLQLRFVIQDAIAHETDTWTLFGAAFIVLFAAIAIRMVWVYLSRGADQAFRALVKWRWVELKKKGKIASPSLERVFARESKVSPDVDSTAAKMAAAAEAASIDRHDPVAVQALAEARIERYRTNNSLSDPGDFSSKRRSSWRFVGDTPSWAETLIISWTGMRGVVTLAAASGIPLLTEAGDPFPGREDIQAIAFVVAIGTLLIQGTTLPWLIKRVLKSNARADAWEEEQTKRAKQIAQEAAITTISGFTLKANDESVTPVVREAAATILAKVKSVTEAQRLSSEEGAPGRDPKLAQISLMLRQRVLIAQREALIAHRDAGNIDDDVMREVLEQLDLQEAALGTHLESAVSLRL